jgi:hypothetical protein
MNRPNAAIQAHLWQYQQLELSAINLAENKYGVYTT